MRANEVSHKIENLKHDALARTFDNKVSWTRLFDSHLAWVLKLSTMLAS